MQMLEETSFIFPVNVQEAKQWGSYCNMDERKLFRYRTQLWSTYTSYILTLHKPEIHWGTSATPYTIFHHLRAGLAILKQQF